MKTLNELKKEIEKANDSMMLDNYFSVEYSKKGFNFNGDYVHHCYILKSENVIDYVGTPTDIIWKLNELTERMVS